MQCNSTGAKAAYGVCYGTKTSKPQTPNEVLETCRKHGISRLCLSPTPPSPNSNVISIPEVIMDDPDSKIKVVMCIDYKDLSPLGDHTKALEWVRTYVGPCASVISHVCVGDVIGSVDFSISIFKDAMRNLKRLLPDSVKLSILVTEFMLLGNTYTALNHPSTCIIEASRSTEILLFLSKQLDYPIPLFVRIMPYDMINKGVPVENCILKDGAKTYINDVVNNVNYSYSQSFDAMLDSICFALKKVAGLGEVDIHVVTGWPTGPIAASDASVKNARDYLSRLRVRIGNPTPMNNKPVEVYIYSLVNEENLETAANEFNYLGAKHILP